VKTKNFYVLSLALVLLAGMVGSAMALGSDYNRPNPVMDYAPQEIAIYDTRYDELDEMDCRSCHGDSLADRHHYSDTVLIQGLCTPCHEVVPEGVVVIRDCTTSECHSWDDVMGANGWHHNTDWSGAENCTSCHDRNVVAEITPLRTVDLYPPSFVTPTPFSCENCHWQQGVVDSQVGFDGTKANAALAGHPSTWDHFDAWGQPVAGWWQYDKPILDNLDTHHMGFKGNVASECYKCHANDPNLPSWDPEDPDLIRYCEICHDITTLHTILPHVGPGGTGDPEAVRGWQAVGFHSGGAAADYRIFNTNEQCLGCHGDDVLGEMPPMPAAAPVINSMTPSAACATGDIELIGNNFGEEQYTGSTVLVNEGAGNWIPVPVQSWTNTRIVFHVPAWTFTTGNHKVKVFFPTQVAGLKYSNLVTLTVKDCQSPTEINSNIDYASAPDGTPEFDDGPCSTVVYLSAPSGSEANGFGQMDKVTTGGTDGLYRTIQISSSQGDYICASIKPWKVKNPNVQAFTFKNFFQDLDGDLFQDANEPTLQNCQDINLGTWYVYMKWVLYVDDDASGDYSGTGAGLDTVYQIEASDPLTFELVNEPRIRSVKPGDAFAKGDIIKIVGENFGPQQETGTLRMGKKADAFSATPGLGKELLVKNWSSTRIRAKAKIPAAWAGKSKYIWIEKAETNYKSNPIKVKILP
jgi:hypothetical protein